MSSTKNAVTTIADFFVAIGKAATIDSYSYITIPNSSQSGSISVSWDEDIDIYFYWVSEHGASDYSLRTKESVGHLNYSYTVKGQLKNKNGSVDSINDGGVVPATTFTPQIRATWDNACQAYQNDLVLVEYPADDIQIIINKTPFTIYQPPLPQNMDALLY